MSHGCPKMAVFWKLKICYDGFKNVKTNAKRANMRVLKFIIKTAKPYRLYVSGIFFAMCLVAIDNSLKPFLIKRFIDIVSGRLQGDLWVIFAFYALLQLMLVGAWTLSDYCITYYTAKFRMNVAEHFMHRLYD